MQFDFNDFYEATLNSFPSLIVVAKDLSASLGPVEKSLVEKSLVVAAFTMYLYKSEIIARTT